MIDILFIQGGGADVHDQWDNKLVASLKRELGDSYKIRYPRIAAEADPQLATWQPELLAALEEVGNKAIVVAHSIGATLVLHTLADTQLRPRALFLIAAPYVGEGGWQGEGLTPDRDFSDLDDIPVHFYHGDADTDVPVSHLDLYARAFPKAQIRRLSGRDHQVNYDLSEVAEAIRG